MAHVIQTLTHITTVGMAARVVLKAVHDHPEPEPGTTLVGREASL